MVKISKSKKAYIYIVEIVLVILLVVAILSFFPASRQAYLIYEQEQNLRLVGFGSLKNLDELGIFASYFATNFSNSNFSALNTHLEAGLPSGVAFDVQYFLDGACFSKRGVPVSCGLNITGERISAVTTHYTHTQRAEPVTLLLYLWRRL